MIVVDLDQARRRRNDGYPAWCYDPFKRRTPQPRSASAGRHRAVQASQAAIARSAQALSLSPMVVSHIRAAAYVIQSWPWPIGRLTRCSV